MNLAKHHVEYYKHKDFKFVFTESYYNTIETQLEDLQARFIAADKLLEFESALLDTRKYFNILVESSPGGKVLFSFYVKETYRNLRLIPGSKKIFDEAVKNA